MKQNTQLVTAGRHPERFGGLVNTPVFRGSTILHDSIAHWEGQVERRARDEFGVSTYGRYGTPTHHALEEAVALLEGGYRALVYPSGLAALTAVLITFLKAGDHVLVSQSVYGPGRMVLEQVLAKFGVTFTLFEPTEHQCVEQMMQPNTKLVYLESPGSQTFELPDIPAIARIAHAHGAKVVMDNTWATPLFYKPFEHGVDVSVQAATKYLVGHSDAMLGIATANEACWPDLRKTTQLLGQTAGPDDVYLALRGLRTLGVRLQQHWKSGVTVASWLETRDEVEAVIHPALSSHPSHALWKRDFTGATGLFAVALRPVSDAALEAFVDTLEHFGIGVSWGGYESLVLPFTIHADRGEYWRYQGPTLRFHIGLEDPDDLIADLERAFAAMQRVIAGEAERVPVVGSKVEQ